jgi:hypothetical protein
MPKRKRLHRTLQPASSQYGAFVSQKSSSQHFLWTKKASLITKALIETAIDKLITGAEAELAALKDKRGSKYTARRKELNQKIAILQPRQLPSIPSVPYGPDKILDNF